MLLVGLVLSALASAADASLRALNRARIQRLVAEGTPRARVLDALLDNPNVYANTLVIVGVAIVVVSAGIVTWLAIWLFPDRPLSVLIALFVFALLLVLVQMAARGIALHRTESTALWLAGPVRATAFVLSPLVAIANWIANGVAHIFGPHAGGEAPAVTEEELRSWVDVGEEAGVIEQEERQMIHSILELEETIVREIMVPRMDIVATECHTIAAEAIDLVLKHGYSRIPVYQESIDNIAGMLYAKDLFKAVKRGDFSMPVGELMRLAYFIPETKKVNELLKEMQRDKVQMAIVVDEYGGVAGLVTMEDLLEEIVGEIQDEYDQEEAKIEKLSETEAVFDATVSVDDVNDTLSLNLEPVEASTIGGLVYERLGKVPVVGDAIQVDSATITVQTTVGRRIKRVKVTVPAKEGPVEEGPEESE